MATPPSADRPEAGPPATAGPACSFAPLAPAVELTEEMLPRARGLDCGTEEWAADVSQWVQLPSGGGGALDAIRDQGAKVWLYETIAGELVGYGSLGQTQWRYPNPKKSTAAALQIIPYFGIAHKWRGLPPGPPEERYASRTFSDLLAKAVKLAADGAPSLLGLLVHKANSRAVRFYERFGFVQLGDRRDHISMVVQLAG